MAITTRSSTRLKPRRPRPVRGDVSGRWPARGRGIALGLDAPAALCTAFPRDRARSDWLRALDRGESNPFHADFTRIPTNSPKAPYIGVGAVEGPLLRPPPVRPWRSRVVPDEDWMLMQRIAGGDEAAMATLYDRFGALVYKAARQVLSSRAEADDAVQDVFIRLWRTADKYDPRRAKLVTWVMLITRRNLIDRLRRKVSRLDTLPLTGEPGVTDRGGRPGESDLDEDQRRKLRERLRELPEIQRTVIERTYFQGYSLREVSEQLNAPLGTVKSALSRGLHRLRDRFGGDRAHG